MPGRALAQRRDVHVALLSAAAVAATFATALLFEAITDRDWSIQDWEWPQVVTLALLSTFVAIWLFLTVASGLQRHRGTRGRRASNPVPIVPSSESRPRDELSPVAHAERRELARRRMTPPRVGAALVRRLPRAPFRRLMPTRVWREAFRFWLSVLAADPDTRRGVKNLLISYDDAYRAVDQAAIRYDGGVHVKHRLTHYHDFFLERVRKGERVLDVGSGKGEVAFDLVTIAEASVVGVDHDPHHLSFARSRFSHPGLEFHEADVLEWLPDGHFDVVVLSNVFEHLDRRVEFLERLVRSATPTRLLFRVPMYERDWTVPLRDEVGLQAFWDSDHEVEYTPETLTSELSQADLEVAELVIRWGEIWCVAHPAAVPR